LRAGFADPAASAFGITMGKTKFCGNKTLSGFFGFIIVCFSVLIASHVLLFNDSIYSLELHRGCFVVALVGGIAELVSGFPALFSRAF
jgi:CDP-diglyceride synthetase